MTRNAPPSPSGPSRALRLRLAVFALMLVVAFAAWLGNRLRPQAAPVSISASAASGAGGKSPEAIRKRFRPRAGWQRIDLSGATVGTADEASIGLLEGRVVSSANARGVAGAEISVAGPRGAVSATSGADGRFSLSPSEEGDHEVVLVTARGFVPFAPELGSSPVRFYARKGASLSGVTLTLQPAVEYLGRVVDPSGAAVSGAHVRLLDTEGDLELSSVPMSHVTDARGEFHFTAPDDTLLEATHPGFSPGRARVDFSVQVSRRLQIALLEAGEFPSGDVRGRVVDETGAPQADVQVLARFEPDGPAFGASVLNPGGRARSDAQGQFRIEKLAVGRYTVIASDDVRAPAIKRGVVTGSAPIVLTLVAGAALSGRVTARVDGAPVPAFTVVVSERRGPLTLETARVSSVFDADGQYVVEPLAPGQYVVSVVAHGFARSAEQTVDIRGATRADFALDRGARLTGVVRDATSKKPLEGAKVTLEGSVGTGSSAVPLASSAVTDEDGEFELLGIGVGLRSVLAAASGHHGRLIGLDVQPGSPPPRLDIELTPTKADEKPGIELVGIGAVLGAKGDVLVIGKVMAGGGAAEVGLAPGDSILAVDGASVVALGFEGSVQRIRGPEGTSVELLVRRGDGGAPAALRVPRRRIKG